MLDHFCARVELAKAAENPTAFSVAVEALGDARRVSAQDEARNGRSVEPEAPGRTSALPASHAMSPWDIDQRSRTITNETASEIRDCLRGMVSDCEKPEALFKIDDADLLVIRSLANLKSLTPRQAALGECYAKKYNDRLFEFLGSQR